MKLQTTLSFAAVLLSTAVASSAAAQAPFKVNDVAVAGSGCERGTFSVRARAGGDQELSIRFRDFDVQGSAAEKDRAITTFKSCNVAADITVAPGFQIAVVDVDYRGRVDVQGRRDTDLGMNNVARIDREYFFNDAGPLGDLDTLRTTRIVNTDSSYRISDNFAFISFTQCNQSSTIARLRLGLGVSGRNYASIRSVEEEADGIRLGVRVRRCNSSPLIVPIGASETVSNACVLEDDGGKRYKVCYDRNSRQISRTLD